MENAAALGARGTPPKILARRGPVGALVRWLLGRKLYRINVPRFAPAGFNFGYCYEASPVIAYDGENAPLYTMGEATPSTVPGCRIRISGSRKASQSMIALIGLHACALRSGSGH